MCAGSDDEALDLPQVARAASSDARLGTPRDLLRTLRRLGRAVAGAGMRIEEARQTRVAEPQALEGVEALQEVGDTAWVVAGHAGQPLSDAVGRTLEIPAEREHLERLRRDEERRWPELLLGCGVAQCHVRDLVAQHARELVFGVRERQQASRYEDVAARQGKRVRGSVVHDREAVIKAVAGCVAGEAPTDRLDVLVQLPILDQAVLGRGLLRHVPPDSSVVGWRPELRRAAQHRR